MDSSGPIPSEGQAAPGRNAFLRLLTSCVADPTVVELLRTTLSA